MPTLERIDYDYLPEILHALHKRHLRDNSLYSVRKYNLKELCIRKTAYDAVTFDETLSIAAVVGPNIEKLYLWMCSLSKPLGAECKFHNLNDVTIMGVTWQLPDVNVFLMNSGGNLKFLKLSQCQVSVPVLVQSCLLLESIHLSDVDFQDFSEQEKDIRPLSSLKRLTLEGCEHLYPPKRFSDSRSGSVTKSLSALFNCCPNLEKMEFCDCRFDDQDIIDVIQLFCEMTSNLRTLTFYDCCIAEVLLQGIVLTCKPLKTLSLNMCDNIDLREIRKLRELIRPDKGSLSITSKRNDIAPMKLSLFM